MWRSSFSNNLKPAITRISNSFLGFPLQSPSSKSNPFPIYALDQNPDFSSIARVFDNFRMFFSAAEAVSSAESEDVEEIQEILDESSKIEVGGSSNNVQNSTQKREYGKNQYCRPVGMGSGKYAMLKRRQVKIETEAWEKAAKEYTELLADMCERKLAPNLPFVKTLFLGWFEPFRGAILKERELCSEPRNKAAHGPYFDCLPAEKMAVITMHKLMSLLMTESGVRVVQAACQVGEAIEQEKKQEKNLLKRRLKTKKLKRWKKSSNLYKKKSRP